MVRSDILWSRELHSKMIYEIVNQTWYFVVCVYSGIPSMFWVAVMVTFLPMVRVEENFIYRPISLINGFLTRPSFSRYRVYTNRRQVYRLQLTFLQIAVCLCRQFSAFFPSAHEIPWHELLLIEEAGGIAQMTPTWKQSEPRAAFLLLLQLAARWKNSALHRAVNQTAITGRNMARWETEGRLKVGFSCMVYFLRVVKLPCRWECRQQC